MPLGILHLQREFHSLLMEGRSLCLSESTLWLDVSSMLSQPGFPMGSFASSTSHVIIFSCLEWWVDSPRPFVFPEKEAFCFLASFLTGDFLSVVVDASVIIGGSCTTDPAVGTVGALCLPLEWEAAMCCCCMNTVRFTLTGNGIPTGPAGCISCCVDTEGRRFSSFCSSVGSAIVCGARHQQVRCPPLKQVPN